MYFSGAIGLVGRRPLARAEGERDFGASNSAGVTPDSNSCMETRSLCEHNFNNMLRYAPLVLAVALAAPVSVRAANATVRQIEIKSSWGGLGKPQQTALVIKNDGKGYRLGRKRIQAVSVDALVEAIEQPVITKPTLEGLGLTKAWLQERVTGIPKKSSWWKLKSGTAKQSALFENSFTDTEFVSKVLPSLFNFSGSDDYPSVEVTLIRDDGSRVTVSSDSQCSFMLPWNISANGATSSTFNSQISAAVAALMPEKATNKNRLDGRSFDVDLAEAVMKNVETDWNLLGVEDKAATTLVILRTEYAVKSVDINPYHDVSFGTKWNKGKGEEENLHATLTRGDFPKNFYDTVILLYKDGKVSGVEAFLHDAKHDEDLVLSVPWLAHLFAKSPKYPGISLLWVHDQSFSNKAMGNFAADMHALGKDGLAEEVRRVQHDVALLNVNYGDYWLVLPDRRMILWRYQSVMGLLGWAKSDFAVRECTDYQGVTGGCVGAVVSPDGGLVR